MKNHSTIAIAALTFLLPPTLSAQTSLSIGADYRLRGVSIEERDKRLPDNDYYEQRIQAYLITDLSRDVEATLRIQSINPWGQETSTTTLVTRYPDADGTPWIQEAFIRLPHIWRDRIVLTLGRQPIVWGDGAVLSDDQLGFNAVRAQVQSPYRWLPADLDAFLAKIDEGLQSNADTDLYGVQIGLDRRNMRWELLGLSEKNKGGQNYQAGSSSTPFTATEIDRRTYGIRFRTTIRDAFVRGEFYKQDGEATPQTGQPVEFAGEAYLFGMGAQSDITKFGRFGAIFEISEGSGDDAESALEDEAFFVSHASRWDGLNRKGMGRYFASTFSDVYASSSPFAPVTTANTGLPTGASGIQTLHFGIEATPLARWTLTFDMYSYKALKVASGQKDLGDEFDFGLIFRYSGLVTFRAFAGQFQPDEAFDPAFQDDATFASIETDVRF